MSFFYQCRRLSHIFLAFRQNSSCGVVSTAFYFFIGRLWWRKKISEKLILILLAFCFFGLWARPTCIFLLKTFRLVCQNCNLRDLGHGAKIIRLLTKFFPAVVSILHCSCPLDHFDYLFSKHVQLFFWFSNSWQKKISLGHESFGRVVNTSFSRVQRNIWWKKMRK